MLRISRWSLCTHWIAIFLLRQQIITIITMAARSTSHEQQSVCILLAVVLLARLYSPWAAFYCVQHLWLDLTYALSLSQIARLHPALPCAAASIFLQLYLKFAIHISVSRSLFHVFLGRSLPLQRCGVQYSVYSAMLSSFLLNVCPSLF